MGYFRDVVKGVSWMGLFRIVTRLVSLARTAIIARILVPAQFGLFGIASLVLSFLEVFTETGINIFLIQEKADLDEYVDTAWMVSVLRGVLLFLLIYLSAPFVSGFFDFEGSLGILRLVSIVPLIRGFINPSEVLFQKNLYFKKEFMLRSSVFFIDSATAVFLAFYLRTAESLVWGLIAGSLFEVIVTNWLIRPRPVIKFDLIKFKKILSRGKWVTLSGIFHYLTMEGDDAVVAKILDASSLGLYRVAYKLSTLPLTEITQVTGKVAFPVFTKIVEDNKRLKSAFTKTAAVSFIVTIPVGIVLYFFPTQIIYLVLGTNWLAAADALKVLAIYGVIRSTFAVPNSLFYSVKKQDWIARILFVQAMTLAVTIIPLTQSFGIVGAGYSTIIASLIPLPLYIYYLRKVFIQ